jgi:tRNA modification GTPase
LRNNITSPENTRVPERESESGIQGSFDNIVAVATPPGRGGVSIVRLSGPTVAAITEGLLGRCPEPRFATYTDFKNTDGAVIDSGIALFFPGPHSYTGENVLELHGHGSPVVMNMLIQRCLQLGARMARPGEFSERAFLNGRLDLTQAEAVADLIESNTESAARSAIKSLQGEFSKRVNALVESVTQLRIFVEAAIDFPDEEIDFLEDSNVLGQLETLAGLFGSLKASVNQGKLLRDGLKVVLTGLPNAGKSSLLNALSNEDRAIVSKIPGTTRDVLEQKIEIDGLPIEFIDTAGIRETTNEIEAEGVRRARKAQQQADLIILVVDDSDTDDLDAEHLLETLTGDQHTSAITLLIRNKIDLTRRSASSSDSVVCVSAQTGEGLVALKEKIKQLAGFRQVEDSQFLARQRHVDALNRAEQFLQNGLEQQSRFRAGELLADDLMCCQKALGEITGEVTSDELLGMIFSSFCIGK